MLSQRQSKHVFVRLCFQDFVALVWLTPTQAISVNTVESSLIGQEGDLSQEDEGVQRRRQEATTPLGSWGFLYF